MHVDEIRHRAEANGMNGGKMKKVELVKAIQGAEGHSPCYDTEVSSVCGQGHCLWRHDSA